MRANKNVYFTNSYGVGKQQPKPNTPYYEYYKVSNAGRMVVLYAAKMGTENEPYYLLVVA